MTDIETTERARKILQQYILSLDLDSELTIELLRKYTQNLSK